MESYDIVGLYDCFLSLSIMFSKSINAVPCISTSFFIAKYSCMDIPPFIYPFVKQWVHQMMGSWVISTFWSGNFNFTLVILLLWTFMYKFLCEYMFSFHPEKEFLGLMVTVSPFKELPDCFPSSTQIIFKELDIEQMPHTR